MTVDYCVVSIGTLSRNRLWGEGVAVRTAHATTTLVRDGGKTILVDPSLPAAALAARLGERAGVDLSAVTDVFCTTLRPVHRRSIEALPGAAWWCSEAELESYLCRLEEIAALGDRISSEDSATAVAELSLVRRFKHAPERFTDQVQLYPMVGASPGSAGLLLTPPTTTIVIAGDAAVTTEHVRRGMVWEGCSDVQAAMESLRDLLELADLIVPGHDNIMLCPGHVGGASPF